MKQHLTLQVESRNLIGNQVRKLRKQSIIPAVIYGKKMPETVQIQLDLNTFLKLFRQSGRTAVVDLNLGTKTFPCLVHKVDVHPVTDVVRHIDFLAIDLKQKTTASVPVSFIGEPDKGSDGILLKQLNSIEVEALPEKIPREIEVDLSKLVNIGDSIKISDLISNQDYEILEDAESFIATLAQPQQEEETVTTATTETTSDTTSTDSKSS